MSWVAIVLVVAPFAAIAAISRNERRRSALRSETIELRADELGVRRVLADGREEQVDWGEVNEVEVVRASRGAHAAYGGVLVLRATETRGCLIPLDRLDETGIRDALVRMLPGFDRAAFDAALRKPPPSRTSCWVRPGTRDEVSSGA